MIKYKKRLVRSFFCLALMVSILIPYSISLANENSAYTKNNLIDENISYDEVADNVQSNDSLDKDKNVELNILSTITDQHDYYSNRLNTTWWIPGGGLGNANYQINIHVIYTITTYGDEYGEITHRTDMTKHQSVAIARIPNYPYVVEIVNTSRYYNYSGGRLLGTISATEWDLRNTWIDYFYDPNDKLFGGAVTKTITNNGYGAHLENTSAAVIKTTEGMANGSENRVTTEIGY